MYCTVLEVACYFNRIAGALKFEISFPGCVKYLGERFLKKLVQRISLSSQKIVNGKEEVFFGLAGKKSMVKSLRSNRIKNQQK